MPPYNETLGKAGREEDQEIARKIGYQIGRKELE
jgi:hypothetical protein